MTVSEIVFSADCLHLNILKWMNHVVFISILLIECEVLQLPEGRQIVREIIGIQTVYHHIE